MSDESTHETEPELYATHRPITVHVRKVYPMPHVRTLPQKTKQTINLDLDLETQREVLRLIEENLKAAYVQPHLFLTAEGIT